MARYLYSELASTLQAYQNCAAVKPGQHAHYADVMQWVDKHESHVLELVREYLPSGSGFDCGTKLDFDASHAEKMVFTTSFHHMNDGGYYDGWTDHTVTVTPSFSGFNIRISGRNRNDIKEYIHETFSCALMTDVAEKIVKLAV